jgi:glutaredoxin 2
MVNENKEEKALLSFQDKDGNQRDIFEKDLNDKTRPLVEEISQDLNAEQQLMEAYQLATKTMHHMEAVRKNVRNAVAKLEAQLPPYKKPVKLEGLPKDKE